MAGRIPFHAPKAAGQFVFRLFDQSTKEKMLKTLGTSPMLVVKIYDFDVTSNLRFCYDSFEDKTYLKGVSQLQSIIIGMCNDGKQTKKDCPKQYLQNCLNCMLNLINDGITLLDNAKEKEKEKKDKYDNDKKKLKNNLDSLLFEIENENEDDNDNDNKNELKKIQRKEDEMVIRQTSKIQIEIYDTLIALQQNDIATAMLYGTFKFAFQICNCYIYSLVCSIFTSTYSPHVLSCPRFNFF